jgi:regulatory protein
MGQQQQKQEKPLTAAALERSALWQLQRRALTEHELRSALQKKAKRAAAVHGDNPLATTWIDALVERLRSSLLLDDVRVATARASSGRARGLSSRRIGMKLREKGIDADTAKEAMASVDGGAVADLEAARVYARKKRLADKDPQKALAALARQGFSFDIAKRALAPVPDDED